MIFWVASITRVCQMWSRAFFHIMIVCFDFGFSLSAQDLLFLVSFRKFRLLCHAFMASRRITIFRSIPRMFPIARVDLHSMLLHKFYQHLGVKLRLVVHDQKQYTLTFAPIKNFVTKNLKNYDDVKECFRPHLANASYWSHSKNHRPAAKIHASNYWSRRRSDAILIQGGIWVFSFT